MADIPPGYIKKRSSTIPFGYKISTIKGYLEPIPEQLEALNKYLQGVVDKAYSLREAAELLSNETGRKISHVGLQKQLTRPAWEIFPIPSHKCWP